MADQVAPAPTIQKERLASLDVLRGFALLGILAMNVMTFAMPLAAYANPTVMPGYGGFDVWVYRIIHIVFDLKMMALFSMLFGAGVVIWANKPAELARPGSLRWIWLRRMFWLFVIGMIHAWLIWEGDILVSYALCGAAVLWWCRRLSPVWLLVVAGGFFLIHLLLMGLQTFNVWMLFSESEAALQMREQSGMPPETIAEQRANTKLFMDPSPEGVKETLAELNGNWMDVFRHRAEITTYFQVWGIGFWLFWRVSAMMLLGAALMKWNVFTGRRSARFYAIMSAVCYAVGLPIVIAGIAYNESHGFELLKFGMFGQWPNAIGSVVVALGHAGLLLWIVRSGLLRGVCYGLARVGQMAFTNYLMQSVLCSLIFYGWGLGLAGDLSRLQQQFVVLGVWAVEIVWSILWLSKFRFGPAEWLWRSLTYWSPQPMRRA